MSKIDLDKRSSVKNLCPWTVSFTLPNSNADILLIANKKTTINNAELAVLVDNGDVMFVGTGNGNHARVYIEDENLRKYVGFESEDGKEKQFIVDDEVCQKLFEYKTLSTFKKNVEEQVVCNHEKHNLIQYARKTKLNDYSRIQFLEEYCGVKFIEE